MWFLPALVTFLAWGTADLFYKKGAVENERYSHLKTSIVVGLVMGVVAIATILIRHLDYNPMNLLVYMPVSLMYILSMTVGYFGLRYLELSVSSPIQNASGAVSCLIMMLVIRELPNHIEWISIALITFGVVMLGVFEKKKNAAPDEGSADLTKEEESPAKLKKYKIGFVAFFMPILYCVIDSLGTALDGIYLDDITSTPLRDVTEDNIEDVANVSYMLTFLLVALALAIFVYAIRREPLKFKGQGPRLAAAGCETLGQFTYAYAMSGNGMVAAPMIASYCVCSIVLARIFLKEKLSVKQYIMVGIVFSGILFLGIAEGLAE